MLTTLRTLITKALAFSKDKKNVSPADNLSLTPLETDHSFETPTKSVRQTIYWHAVIALASKLEQVRSQHKRLDFMHYFIDVFKVPSPLHYHIIKLFEDVKHDPAEATHYAKQLYHYYPDHKAVLLDVLLKLLQLSCIEYPPVDAEFEFLKKITLCFQLPFTAIHDMLRTHIITIPEDPYACLQIDYNIDAQELKHQYRRMLQSCHPDKLYAYQAASAYMERATERFYALQKAYARIVKERGFDKIRAKALNKNL